jgi:hypothetical protein
MDIKDKIEEARQIFLTDVDEEVRNDNLERITEWEQSLRLNGAFLQWQENEISKILIKEFKTTYKNASLRLAQTRELTEGERASLWATKDACLMVLSLLAKDAKGEVESVHKEIDYALGST